MHDRWYEWPQEVVIIPVSLEIASKQMEHSIVSCVTWWPVGAPVNFIFLCKKWLAGL